MPEQKPRAEVIEVDEQHAGQRIDNFLITHLKGVPKTRLYRALRGGEVRVNGGRKKAPYQLCVGDKLRIPPLRRSAVKTKAHIPEKLRDEIKILLEDEHLLIVNKPAGLAVHGGSNIAFGLIEALRALRPDDKYLELAHRLDRETSGCLLLAKSRKALLAVQAQLTAREVHKEYVALLCGAWSGGAREVNVALAKHADDGGKTQDAHSVFTAQWSTQDCTFAAIKLLTGRMHQARRHAAAIGMPVAGDKVYGDYEFNRRLRRFGLTRLFLHAARVKFSHPASGKCITVAAPLPPALTMVLEKLRAGDDDGNG